MIILRLFLWQFQPPTIITREFYYTKCISYVRMANAIGYYNIAMGYMAY